MSGSVVVVGPIVRDVTMLVGAVPDVGNAATAERLCVEAGGKGGNPAVAAAALGVPVTLVGVVGDDEAGAAIRAELAARGVGVDGVQRIDGEATGHNVHLVEPGGRRRYVEA